MREGGGGGGGEEEEEEEEASFAWLKNHLSFSNIATRDASSALLDELE